MTIETFSTSDLIEKIRAYQSEPENTELLRSHHFVFDCPVNKSHVGRPSFIWLGLNPGGDDHDWKRHPQHTEESRDYDFQEAHGRSKGSKDRMGKLEGFVGNDVFRSMTHSQWFFWCSNNATDEFKKRYGYSYRGNPHWDFCCAMNRDLIKRARPLAVMAESKKAASMNASRMGLRKAADHKNADGTTLVEEWRFDDEIPLYSFDHLSALLNLPNCARKLSGSCPSCFGSTPQTRPLQVSPSDLAALNAPANPRPRTASHGPRRWAEKPLPPRCAHRGAGRTTR